MRNYGISRYAPYRHTSLYNRNRTSVYQQFSTKSNSANAARKAYQSNTYSGTTVSRLNEAVSGVATSVSALSKAMQTDAKTGALDREKAYSAAKDFVDSYNELYSSVKSSRSGFVSGRTTVIANTARAYSGTLEDAGVTVAKDGSISGAVVAKPCPYSSLNESALAAVQAVPKFDPIPAVLGKETWKMEIPIKYNLH